MAWIRQEQLSSLLIDPAKGLAFPLIPMSILWVLGSPSSWLENWGKGSSSCTRRPSIKTCSYLLGTSVGFVHIWSCKNWGNRLSTSWWNPCQATEQIHLQGHCLNPSHAMPCFMSCLAEASTNHGNVIVLASSSASTFPWSVMACCAACTLQGRGHGLKSFLSGRGDPDHRERWCWSENWQDP